MSSCDTSPPPADRLVAACANGDLPSAEAAVADGASINGKGKAPGIRGMQLPLVAAVFKKHHDAVVWLLSHGADPSGEMVMCFGAWYSTTAILQLLIDAGGDVNQGGGVEPALFAAVRGVRSKDNVRVLLAQPSLDCTIGYLDETPEQWARDKGGRAVADMIAREVGRRWGLRLCLGSDR